jgi:dihydroneopterin aldolase
MIGEISLQGIEFFAYHGFYSEERKIGNKYQVDLTLTADLGQSSVHDDLSQTVDYEKVYKIIKQVVEIPTKLLETIAHKILELLFADFPQVISAEVSVSKFNPPVGGICKTAKVKLKKNRVE